MNNNKNLKKENNERIFINKELIHFSFDQHNEPVAYAKNGDTVQFCCQDCYCNQVHQDGYEFKKMDMSRNNPATGPLFIKDANPGDILRVEIVSIDIHDSGSMCARTGAGIYDIEGNHCRKFKIEDGMILFDQDIKVPIRPMVGVIGTAPKGEGISTQIPGEHGGNLDIKDLCEGTTLYLPVNVDGALLSIGDIHAVQGDGETVICAMEVSGDVIVKLDVLKEEKKVPTPFIVTKEKYITVASDESLDICSKMAAQKMHEFLQNHSALSDIQSGLLLSISGNLRISQVVNPKKSCVMDFPIGLANEMFNI